MTVMHPVWAAFNINQISTNCQTCANVHKFSDLCSECKSACENTILQTISPENDSIIDLFDLIESLNVQTYTNSRLNPATFYDSNEW